MNLESRWPRYRSYRIDRGNLVPGKGGGGTWYDPNDTAEVVTDLAMVEHGDEEAVLRFAEKWGLLGYNAVGVYNPDSSIELGQGPTTTDGLPDFRGDDLEWFYAHAESVRRVLRLSQLLRDPPDARQSAIKEYLDDIRNREDSIVGDNVEVQYYDFAILSYPQTHRRKDSHEHQFLVEFPLDDPLNPEEIANLLVDEVINRNIEPIKNRLVAGLAQLTVPALLCTVYMHLFRQRTGDIGKTA